MSTDWFASMSACAWAIVALAGALVVTGIVAAVVRGPRGLAIALVVASALPPIVGLGGTIGEMLESFRTIEALNAPTPKDLAAGVKDSLRCTTLGFAAMVVCGATGVAALVRSKAPPPPPARSA